jgi:hypothetical protein
MTTLAANVNRNYELGDYNAIPVIASDIVYKGAAVGDNGSGYARPLVAGDPFLGFADSQVDNAAGSAGDKAVSVLMRGSVVLSVTGATGVGDVGEAVYASDDATFTMTASTNSYIGRIVRHISSTTVLVAFDATRASLANLVALTDSSGGTASDTIAAIGGTYSQAEVRNAVASLAAKINALAARIK